MTLKDRMIRQIAADGPIPVSTFMQIALHDPTQGYYATRPGIGEDFATAPEISPLFGELIGLWLVHEWRAMGSPSPFYLIEIGPGRGTLMLDALRLSALAGGEDFVRARKVCLIEPSPALRKLQAARLAEADLQFFEALHKVPEGPALIIANEFLDCLPARQFRRVGEAWHELVVGLDDAGALAFGLAAEEAPAAWVADDAQDALDVQPALDSVIADLLARQAPMRALFADYGPADKAPGDTLRAYTRGRQSDPLADPGVCDLTVDVDFGRFARLGVSAGLDVAGPLPQGMFLLGLGAQARLNQMVRAFPDEAERIYAQARRLIDPADMGERFKMICVSSKGLAKPAGF